MQNTTIKETINYSIFDLHEHNRDVNEKSVRFKNLIMSMQKHGFLDAFPLDCIRNGNGRLKVRSGHHRLKAAAIVGIPVKYVITKSNITIQELENAGPGRWSMRDYLSSFCRQGKKDYIIVDGYVKETGINISVATSLFYGHVAGSNNAIKDGGFFEGEFKIKNYKLPYMVADIVLHLKEIGITFATNTRLVSAISMLYWVDAFDIERFKKKSRSHKSLFEKQADVSSYLSMIEKIYNKQTKEKEKVNLSFLAKIEKEKRFKATQFKKKS